MKVWITHSQNILCWQIGTPMYHLPPSATGAAPINQTRWNVQQSLVLLPHCTELHCFHSYNAGVPIRD
jgi:hypothetical protein